MLRLFKKLFTHNRVLELIQKIFCTANSHRKNIHAKVMHHVHTKKHHYLPYIHVILLVIVLGLYNIISFNRADDLALPSEGVAIVIENEPQILPDQIQEELAPVVADTVQELTTESPSDMITGEVVSVVEVPGDATSLSSTGNGAELVSSTGDVVNTGIDTTKTEELINQETNKEILSGILQTFSGEKIYDLS